MSDGTEHIAGLTSAKLVQVVRRAMVEATQKEETQQSQPFELPEDRVELSGKKPVAEPSNEEIKASLPMDKYLKILEEMPEVREDRIAEVEQALDQGYDPDVVLPKLLDALENELLD